MTVLTRGMIIDVNLDPVQGAEKGKTRPCVIMTNDIYNQRVSVIQVIPLTGWSEKKSKVKTNVEIQPTAENGLDKLSLADCLQARPIDYRHRLVKIRGTLAKRDLQKIEQALKIVFDLS
jgi:mRNA interferase MazF